jgi:hypothetical protein
MKEAVQIMEQADSIVKALTPDVLRMISVSLQYSITTDDFLTLKKVLEASGFMIRINEQMGKTLHITLTYLRNWGGSND